MKQTAQSRKLESPDVQLKSFVAKFDPAVAKLIRSCRSALRKRFPTANELVYDNEKRCMRHPRNLSAKLPSCEPELN